MLYVILNAAKQAIEMELKRIEKITVSKEYHEALAACKFTLTQLMKFL